MIGWIIGGIIAAAAVSAIVVYVVGIIDKNKLKAEMKGKLTGFLVTEINRSINTVKLEDLNSDDTYEVIGDYVSYDVSAGEKYYV
jgi:hypothetical protein